MQCAHTSSRAHSLSGRELLSSSLRRRFVASEQHPFYKILISLWMYNNSSNDATCNQSTAILTQRMTPWHPTREWTWTAKVGRPRTGEGSFSRSSDPGSLASGWFLFPGSVSWPRAWPQGLVVGGRRHCRASQHCADLRGGDTGSTKFAISGELRLFNFTQAHRQRLYRRDAYAKQQQIKGQSSDQSIDRTKSFHQGAGSG